MPPVVNVHVGVCAVVRRPSRRRGSAERYADLLLVQRGSRAAYADGYGTWGLPGGWLEFGEDPFDAARRETLEETGVVVKPVRQDGYDAGVASSGKMHIVTLFVLCDFISGEPDNLEPDKQLHVGWMPEEVLAELDLFGPLDRWWRRPRPLGYQTGDGRAHAPEDVSSFWPMSSQWGE